MSDGVAEVSVVVTGSNVRECLRWTSEQIDFPMSEQEYG